MYESCADRKLGGLVNFTPYMNLEGGIRALVIDRIGENESDKAHLDAGKLRGCLVFPKRGAQVFLAIVGRSRDELLIDSLSTARFELSWRTKNCDEGCCQLYTPAQRFYRDVSDSQCRLYGELELVTLNGVRVISSQVLPPFGELDIRDLHLLRGKGGEFGEFESTITRYKRNGDHLLFTCS